MSTRSSAALRVRLAAGVIQRPFAARSGRSTHGRQILATDGWCGQEQAILLLVTLDDKTIVDRLLTLLAATRPEMHATAAWGLCQLQVPATTDAILDVYTKTKREFSEEAIRR